MIESHRVTKKSRILIADPDGDIRETMALYFGEHGYEVRVAEGACNIEKIARPWQPRAILISTEFRDVEPYHVCRELLADTLTSHIPIIMLLHVNERQARLKALEVGISDLVTKPFDIEELLLRVEAAIRLSTIRIQAA